jgi:hypothetical protein
MVKRHQRHDRQSSDYEARVGSRAAPGRLSAAGEPVLNYYHVL